MRNEVYMENYNIVDCVNRNMFKNFRGLQRNSAECFLTFQIIETKVKFLQNFHPTFGVSS